MRFHRKTWPTVEEKAYPSDEIDALVRRALRDSVSGEEPPPEVWHRIRARLEQPKGQSPPRRGRLLSAQFSLLVQLLVLGIIILLAFGLSLRPGFDLSVDREYVVNGTLTPQPGSEKIVLSSTDDDVPRGSLHFLLSRELTIFDYRLVPYADTYRR
jgi:hypothetical protein